MNKFIITDEGIFRYGDVQMHKDLLSVMEDCLGGGYWEINPFEQRLFLWGKSYDFGPPLWHHLDRLIVPEKLQGLRITYEDEELDIPIEYR